MVILNNGQASNFQYQKIQDSGPQFHSSNFSAFTVGLRRLKVLVAEAVDSDVGPRCLGNTSGRKAECNDGPRPRSRTRSLCVAAV